MSSKGSDHNQSKSERKTIVLKEGLFTLPSSPTDRPQLIGAKCPICGLVVFPKTSSICPNCMNYGMELIHLSRKGKLYSYTRVMQKPPEYYRGPVPYALGFVELPEGVRVESLLTDCDFEKLKIGMNCELVIEKLHDDDDGNEVITYKFRPV